MDRARINREEGFSLVELLISMSVTLGLLAVVSAILASAMGTRARQSQKTDALASARAALQIISREVAQSGYGLSNNGMVLGDSDNKRIHFRNNRINTDLLTDDPGEDVTFFFEPTTKSIVRYDRFGTYPTSVVVNGISDVTFRYFDYPEDNSGAVEVAAPTRSTGRVTVTVTVLMNPVSGQLSNEKVQFSSDITLRNSNYMLYQY